MGIVLYFGPYMESMSFEPGSCYGLVSVTVSPSGNNMSVRIVVANHVHHGSFIYIYTHIYTFVCVFVLIFIPVHIQMSVFIYIYICTHPKRQPDRPTRVYGGVWFMYLHTLETILMPGFMPRNSVLQGFPRAPFCRKTQNREEA